MRILLYRVSRRSQTGFNGVQGLMRTVRGRGARRRAPRRTNALATRGPAIALVHGVMPNAALIRLHFGDRARSPKIGLRPGSLTKNCPKWKHAGQEDHVSGFGNVGARSGEERSRAKFAAVVANVAQLPVPARTSRFRRNMLRGTV